MRTQHIRPTQQTQSSTKKVIFHMHTSKTKPNNCQNINCDFEWSFNSWNASDRANLHNGSFISLRMPKMTSSNTVWLIVLLALEMPKTCSLVSKEILAENNALLSIYFEHNSLNLFSFDNVESSTMYDRTALTLSGNFISAGYVIAFSVLHSSSSNKWCLNLTSSIMHIRLSEPNSVVVRQCTIHVLTYLSGHIITFYASFRRSPAPVNPFLIELSTHDNTFGVLGNHHTWTRDRLYGKLIHSPSGSSVEMYGNVVTVPEDMFLGGALDESVN